MDSLEQPTAGQPDDARQSDGQPAPTDPEPIDPEPLDAWPLRGEPYDARIDKQRIQQRAAKFGVGAVSALIVGALLLIWSMTMMNENVAGPMGAIFPLLGLVAVALLLYGIITGAFSVDLCMRMSRASRLPDDGFVLTEQSMLDAYGRYGLKEIRLATPTISHDEAGDPCVIERNGFTALWFQPGAAGGLASAGVADGASRAGGPAVADGVRSYALWWRDHDWPDLESLKLSDGRIADLPMGYDPPAGRNGGETAEYMTELFQRHRVDLRMWPCVLEVRGDRGRLLFDPNAEKTASGPKDPLIEEGIGTVYRLR